MPKNELSPTVYGIETEYSALITMPGERHIELAGPCHSPDFDLDLYVEPEEAPAQGVWSMEKQSEALQTLGIFQNESGLLSNGGKLYIDFSGPEYATAETTTAEEAVLRSFDGDQIVYRVLQHFRNQGYIDAFQLNRRNVDHSRSSRGVHLNHSTLIDLNADYPVQPQYLFGTLNVIKGAMFGSGGLMVNPEGGTDFYHSPRLALTTQISANTNGFTERPLVRRPFKEDIGCFRMETITSDALNYLWPLRASLVITNALIKIIELRQQGALPVLTKFIQSARFVGKYGDEVELGVHEPDGTERFRKPTSLLQTVVEVALTAHDTYGHLDEESTQVLEEIYDVADIMQRDQDDAAYDVESIARKAAIEQRAKRGKVNLHSETMCRFDYYWDLINGGLAEHLRVKKGAGQRGFASTTNQDMEHRIVHPPSDTRAKVRGNMILESSGHALCDWQNISENTKVSTSSGKHPLDCS